MIAFKNSLLVKGTKLDFSKYYFSRPKNGLLLKVTQVLGKFTSVIFNSVCGGSRYLKPVHALLDRYVWGERIYFHLLWEIPHRALINIRDLKYHSFYLV